ncbi:FH2 domain containing 3 [Anarrhichthys ocellatus]|uniref:FH2 domain containing 3 n=1 Tax=Anarrhichthys ocellatus TaxID=433405 RepID=UPI0012EDA47F|nr:FH2 domain-containing protein 1-like [Anarrhichthys ocellatus]XP_031728528.1 FH2 domain-containing protein 1-like [Anarrhichthys ocellatus]
MEGVLILKSASPPNFSSQDSSPLSPDSQEDSDLESSSPAPPPMCVTAAPAPPPPAPPPPPPPPPPLPPPPFSRTGHRRSMKKLNWDTIPSQRVLGKLNVWTSKRPQRDLVLDIPSMEELFSHVDKRASLPNLRIVGLKTFDGMDLFPKEPQVTILDSKKSMNIGIFLRHFKRPVTEMVQDICKGNWLRFGTGKLKELCKLLPEESEVKQLLSFSGNLSVLPEADQFMVQLVKVPGYEERLKTMVLREEFFPLMEDVKNSFAVMTKAANELLECDDLHSVIRLVLKAGNYMNAGGYSASANAIGFRMTSLLKLADTKANKPGMNLMHYVAKQAEDIDAELLTFHTQLEHIGLGSRVCKEEVIADFEREVKKVKEVKLYSSRQPGLIQQMETFLVRAEAKLADLETSLRELKALNNAVAEYFCEDPATFKLEECCSIFHSFCKRFDTAVRDNREREAAEQRRKQKESVRIVAKRRSTVSCLGPERDQDSLCLESALHSFLANVPDGIVRCRKNILPTIEGSPSECSSPNVRSVAKTEAAPRTRQERPEKKQPKFQEEDGIMAELKNKEEAQKMREITRKVLRYQNGESSLDEDRVSGTPPQSESTRDTPATPSTPQPRTRDFFFSDIEGVGSPWTILSPFTCTQRNGSHRDRQSHQRRLSSASGGDDLDDGVWESDEGNYLPYFSNQENGGSTSAGSTSLPECPIPRTVSKGPMLRAVSMDETRRSPGSGFRLGDLFQRSMSQRSSYSSGSRTENVREEEAAGVRRSLLGRKAGNHVEDQGSTSGFISFFRHIGSRSKPVDVEEQPRFKGSNT